MTKAHKALLIVSRLIIVFEIIAIIYYYETVYAWLSNNLWVVVVPFIKVLFKKIIALKLVIFFKAVGSLLFNLLKLLLLKVIKTLTIRYGVFFSQRKWRWMRWCKVLFLRKGKLLFRYLSRFWSAFEQRQKYLVWIAFFPIVILLFFLGLSFNVTRKTMVKKTQETAVLKTAVSAGNSSKGIRAWISKLDRNVLDQIKKLTLR